MIVCPRCGKLNESIAPTCVSCGQVLSVTLPLPQTSSLPEYPNTQTPFPAATSPFPARTYTPPAPYPYGGTPAHPTPASAPAGPAMGNRAYPPQTAGRRCLVCGFIMMALPTITSCPSCGTPIGMIADPNDPTCSNYLPYTGRATPLLPRTLTPPRNHKKKK